MNTAEIKELLLNKINEKAKEELTCEEIRTLCEAWRVIAGQESLDNMKDMAFPFSIPQINNN